MKELFESSYLSAMSEENNRLRKEIERLNNIINDLYNGLEQIIEQGYDYSEKDFIAGKLQDKINELKGSDKQ